MPWHLCCGVWVQKRGIKAWVVFFVLFSFFFFSPKNLLSNREEEFKMKGSGETLKWLKEESLQKSVFS